MITEESKIVLHIDAFAWPASVAKLQTLTREDRKGVDLHLAKG